VRIKAALGLACYAGLPLGEVHALAWSDVGFEAGTVSVRRSAQPDGTMKAPKTECMSGSASFAPSSNV
jgi:integrase